MKRRLTMVLAFLMLAALFAACAGNGSVSGTKEPTGTDSPAVIQTDAGGEDSPYNLPAGKYETDGNGVPKEPYEYPLPLSTTDEVFTYWACPSIVDAIPESGYEEMPYPAALTEKTGVHLEYHIIGWAERATNFSVLLASDDLPDLMTNPDWYYPGPLQQAVDDGFFANLYDYKDYMPNYYLEAHSHPEDINVKAKIIPYPETIYCFYCMKSEYMTDDGLGARGDWLDRLGMSNEDIVTIDDLHNLLKLFKSEIGAEYPYTLLLSLDPHNIFSAYDTVCAAGVALVAPPIIVDGRVEFANSRPQDLNFMTMLNQWWNDGLITPNWASMAGSLDAHDDVLNGVMGVMGMIPGEAHDFSVNNVDPDAYFVPLHKPVLSEGQVFHLGDVRTWISLGAWAISAKCANIPLLTSYCDWFYSPSGAFFSNYGVEGYTFYYDENGKPMLTDFLVNHPFGMSSALLQFAMNDVNEGGVLIRSRAYAYPGGEKLAAFHTFWDDQDYYRYDGTMQWPSAVTFTPEQNSRLADLGSDIKTYITENYLQFVDNSRPLSDWETYVAGFDQLGWSEAREIYQTAYDDFMERFGG